MAENKAEQDAGGYRNDLVRHRKTVRIDYDLGITSDGIYIGRKDEPLDLDGDGYPLPVGVWVDFHDERLEVCLNGRVIHQTARLGKREIERLRSDIENAFNNMPTADGGTDR